MDISEVTLQVDTYGLGLRGAQSWGDTLWYTLWAQSGMGNIMSTFVLSFRAAQSWGDTFRVNYIMGGHH